MPTWTIKADRRKVDYSRVVAHLRILEESVQGLTIEIVAIDHFQNEIDAGNFRDFAPVAHFSHRSSEALEIVAEELILEFGWLIDLARKACETP